MVKRLIYISDLNKLDTDKLKTAPTDLSKLSNIIIKLDVVKKGCIWWIG